MTTTIHRNMTGADLHEPKGADTALSGYVYVSNGAGSGVWTLASSIVTNSAFSTGDLKPTHKATQDAGWIFWSDNTIGDGSSGAVVRANADTAALFSLYWNNYSDAQCPVSGGRGASAVADFSAHKTITLPKAAGRVFGLAGAGSGLTLRVFGDSTGAETVSLAANQIPSLTSTANNSISVTSTVSTIVKNTGTISSATASGGSEGIFTDVNAVSMGSVTSTNASQSITVAYTNGSLQTVSLMQPTAWVNVLIKL